MYENKVISEGGVRQWCIMFKNGRTNFHDEERSSRPTIVTDELVSKINGKVHETITEFSLERLPLVSKHEDLASQRSASTTTTTTRNCRQARMSG